MNLLWYFLAGVFYADAIPHMIKGITGQTHMTPFKRVSSPLLNVLWAFVNLAVALFLLGLASGKGGVVLPWNANIGGATAIAFALGVFLTAVYLANFWSNPNARLPWHKD